MNGLPEAIQRVPPAPFGTSEVNAAQNTSFTAGVSTAAVAVPGAVALDPVDIAGGCFITFIWIPTVADELVRLCFGGAGVSAATANDRAFMAGVEYDYWLPAGWTHFRGLSVGGGNLSWHRSSR